MASKQIANFGDLLQTTLAHFERPDYVSLLTDKTDHPAAKQLIKKSRMKAKSGTSLDWRLQVTTGNSAANVAVTDQDQVNIEDGFISASLPWRKSKVSYAFYDEELTVNREPWALVDLIKAREMAAMVAWIELLENNFWNAPSASDTLTPLGLPYFCTKNATEGFNGGLLSGFSDFAGLSTATYPRLKNYTGQYTAVTADDFVLLARKMAILTDFKPPVPNSRELTSGGASRGYYLNLTLRQSLENYGDSRNDNLGRDLNPKAMMLNNADLNYVPTLNDDTTNPFYQIDWSSFGIYVLDTWWQKRTVLSPYPGQRNVSAVFLDSIYQFITYNRRLNGVLATGTTYPS